MKTLITIVLAALAAVGAGVCPAAAETPAPADTISTRLQALEVQAPSVPWGDTNLDRDELRSRRGVNLAENLAGLPGVAAVHRSANSAEPVIRGLGWERVRTMLGAVPLYGACPGRMDPPATYLSPLATDEVSLFRAGGGDMAGAGGGTGGAIVARPDYERRRGDTPGTDPWLGAAYDGARDGWQAEGGVLGRTETLDYKLAVGHREADDYTTPDNRLVPAGAKTSTVAGSMAWQPSDGQRLWYAGSYVQEQDVDFPAMPMDNIASDFRAHNAGWRLQYAAGAVRRIELTAGLAAIDHLMDNSMKSTWGMMHATTDAATRSFGAHAVLDLVPAAGWRVRTGLDVTRLGRDATRVREMVMSGARFTDRSWPDAVQLSAGAFAAVDRDLGERTTLELSGRGDVVDSKARAADAASLGGMTVREQYVNFYGPDAANTDRTETLGQVGLGLRGTVGDDGSGQWRLRTGLSTRTAGITERYYAFGPAPGGFQIGDPTLAAEKKWEIEAGATTGADRFTLGASIFHARVADYILPTVVDRRDVNGDAVTDVIKGFVNVDATLTGAELGGEWRPMPRLYVPLTISVVKGRNTTDDRDLPEMPPLFGTGEVRWLALPGQGAWLHGGCDFAATQDRIDPAFGEDPTGGWTVWRVGVEWRPRPGSRIDITVENLFDRLYNDHLTREAVLNAGDLLVGDEVPAPGRRVVVTAHLGF